MNKEGEQSGLEGTEGQSEAVTIPKMTATDAASASKQSPLATQVRFWGIFAALCLLAFISALDVAIITTALPTITSQIGGARQFVWIANSFVVASCVLQPLFGQLADAFGRRTPLLTSVILFILGSGIAGGANSPNMLIAGRTVQGAGAGGIYVLLDIVCCDLVPMRERGKWLGLVFSWSGVAAALGPPVGGALAQTNWRWIFYLNIPICGAVVVLLLLFMRVQTGQAVSRPMSDTPEKHTRFHQLCSRLRRLDYLGSLIFIPGMISLLYGLVMGGTDQDHQWSSWRIIVPLSLGVVGWSAFHIQQFFSVTPSVPPRLFTNRTSSVAFALTFTSAFLVQAISYFFPVYLQAVKKATVLESGTFFLPFAIGVLASAVISGILLTKFGAYRPLHAASFGLSSLGFGLLAGLLDSNTSKAIWVILELITSLGLGLSMSVLLPAIMAGLPESDVATSSATYSFIRTFGYIWGVTLPGIIFNSVVDLNLHQIANQGWREKLRNGGAYSFASQVHGLASSIDSTTLDQIESTYTSSLRVIWWLSLGISLVSFLLVGIERSLDLRTDLDTAYGLEHGANEVQESGPRA
ncbi:MFS general substrate transporter [Xylariaceae sp. FL1019]|nr:MFS general substrate transporter [Xylariaceae sp. FL1019]